MSAQLSSQAYTIRAQKIHAEILNTCDETLASIDKLKNESFADRLYILRIANTYADDLNKVLFSLSRVAFKIDNAKHSRHSLQHVINILCDLTSAIRKSFLFNYEEIKTELKHNIKSATNIAERVFAIIRLDDIHEHKLAILNNQADILFAVDKVRIACQCKFFTPDQWGDLVQHQADITKTILLSLDSKDPNIKQKIIQYTNHCLHKHQTCCDHILNEATSGIFTDAIKNEFLNISREIHKYIGDMHKLLLLDSQFDQAVEDCHKVILNIVGSIIKVVALASCADPAVSENGAELIVNANSNSIGCVYQFRRSLEYIKNDN